jgi:aspartoacylase
MKKVLVVGGTHGNEWIGATVVEKYATTFKSKFPQLDLQFVFGNPEAYRISRRFKEEDLNRAFQFLHETRDTYEHHRAREIKQQIDQEPCFVIDLHTTTSNMGKTVILCHENQLNLFVAERASREVKDCRVILSPDPGRKYLVSQSDFGMMIEVGPIANSLIDGKILEETLEILDNILTSLHKEVTAGELEIYEEIQDISYPENAFIHPDFQSKDFIPVRGEYSPFKRFNGEVITEKASEELFPIFINEAAYYPQKLAFTLCRKRKLSF